MGQAFMRNCCAQKRSEEEEIMDKLDIDIGPSMSTYALRTEAEKFQYLFPFYR